MYRRHFVASPERQNGIWLSCWDGHYQLMGPRGWRCVYKWTWTVGPVEPNPLNHVSGQTLDLVAWQQRFDLDLPHTEVSKDGGLCMTFQTWRFVHNFPNMDLWTWTSKDGGLYMSFQTWMYEHELPKIEVLNMTVQSWRFLNITLQTWRFVQIDLNTWHLPRSILSVLTWPQFKPNMLFQWPLKSSCSLFHSGTPIHQQLNNPTYQTDIPVDLKKKKGLNIQKQNKTNHISFNRF